MSKRKILIVMGGRSMGYGGIESMIMNYYRRIDKTSLQIDFVFFGDGEGIYDDELRANGSRLFHIPIKSKHYFKSNKALKQLLISEKYDIIHANLNAAGIYSALKIANKCGVKIRISHAHSTNHGTTSKLRWLINDYARKRIVKYSTHNFACSDMAADWYYNGYKSYIVPNAVDTKLFVFDKKIRADMRKKLCAENDFIIGHVGNLGYPKNQIFAVMVFAAVKKKCAASQLWLIGEGEDRAALEAKVYELNIADSVKFLGRRDDINELMQAMDCFVLPSLFEGFPVVIAEAAAADLPCVVSDTVTKSVVLTDKIILFPLEAGAEAWSDKMLEYINTSRKDNCSLIAEKGFDITKEAEKLEFFYHNGRFNE